MEVLQVGLDLGVQQESIHKVNKDCDGADDAPREVDTRYAISLAPKVGFGEGEEVDDGRVVCNVEEALRGGRCMKQRGGGA